MLVQLDSTNGGGAAGLQTLIAAIDGAAAGDFEPDMVILPGGCDTGGKRQSLAIAGRFSTFSETIAWKAREWGIYVVACLHAGRDGAARAIGMLYDPDGDVVVQAGDESDDRTEKRVGGHWFPSPVGWIGLANEQCGEFGVTEMRAPEADGFVAVSCFSAHGGMDKKSDVSAASVEGAYIGMAGWADRTTANAHARSFVLSPDGAIIAAADAAGNAVVNVEIDLHPPAKVVEPVDRQTG